MAAQNYDMAGRAVKDKVVLESMEKGAKRTVYVLVPTSHFVFPVEQYDAHTPTHPRPHSCTPI